jgi:hypothetical protein
MCNDRRFPASPTLMCARLVEARVEGEVVRTGRDERDGARFRVINDDNTIRKFETYLEYHSAQLCREQ